MNIRAVKQKILGRIKPNIIPETTKIIVNLPRSCLIIGDNQLPGHIRLSFYHQVNLLRIHTAADLHRSLFPGKIPAQLFKFRQFC